MKFILILLYFFSISRYVDITPLGVSATSQWWSYLTFSLVHLSFWHLFTNSFAFLMYWRVVRRLNYYITIPIITLIPVVAARMSLTVMPTVGLSAVVYSMIGIYITVVILSRRQMIKFISLIVLSFIVTYYFTPQINTLIHIYSFLLSVAAALMLRRWIIR